jgi:hypothetical protein
MDTTLPDTESCEEGAQGQEFWRISQSDSTTLTVRFSTQRLVITELQSRIDELKVSFSGETCRVVFDLAEVNELCGPWGSHFALLVHWAQEQAARVSVSMIGLHGQPLGVAWIFRQSCVLRQLLAASIVTKEASTDETMHLSAA